MELREPSNNRLTLQLCLLAAGTFVLGVDGFVLAGLLPAVAADLHVGIPAAGQLTTAFALAYAIGSPIIATVTGRLDRRTVLGVGMVVFLVGMVAQAVGPTFGTVLAGRVVAGLGAAAFQANAFAVAGVLAPPERRARALAVVGAGVALATVAGVPFGVLAGQVLGWRAALWLIVALAAVAAALTVLLPRVVLPAVPLRTRLALFGNPRMLALLVLTALLVIPQFAVVAYVAPLLGSDGPGASRVLVALVVFGVAFVIGNRLVGHLVDRFGSVPVQVVGLSVSLVALLGLWAVRPAPAATLVAFALFGLVGSFQVIPQQNRVFAAGGPVATVALGLNGSMIYVGSGLGAALGGGVVATAGTAALAPVAAGAVVVTLVAVALTRRVDRTAPSPTPA
ncbi:MFS transporter [Pseudonocardia ailaonensis]|uniref:MFS transporter n=1 Tax=Pseudonocardia ailaonensis TaxID=367279 RepID=A0ABN2MTS1_9PSEU